MQFRKLLLCVVATVVMAAAWIICNSPGRFGWSFYACTTYNLIPRPVSDLQIRSDGVVRKVAKTHDIRWELIEWLLEPKPGVLIIAIGWDGVARTEERIRSTPKTDVRILRNKEAIEAFNELKRSGRRVAIHFHSTC